MASTSINFPSTEPPDVLYHYTRLDAFSPIISKRVLWLSDIAAMNDAKERLWISEVFRRTRDKRQSLGEGDLEAGHYFHDFQVDTTPIFIACFSPDGDVLSQWRAYADDGRGVAIGFRTARLGFPVARRFVDEFVEEQRVAIAKCIYDRGRQEQLLDELISYFDGLFVRLSRDQESYSIYAYDLFLSTARWFLRNMSAISKHPGFVEEAEWRAIYWPHGYGETTTGFPSAGVGPRHKRTREGNEVAYHPWTLTPGDDLIAEVVIGPKSSLSPEVVVKDLVSHGFVQVAVRCSDIPYR